MSKPNELVIAFTLGSIIDTKKAEEVFETEGTKAYTDILKKHKEKNSIFAPGPALGTMMALRRLNRQIPDEVLKISFVLISKIDPNPSIHSVLFDSMSHYLNENKVDNENHNYGFDMISLTGGEDVSPFLKAIEADLVFTTSKNSARELFLNNINAVHIPNISKEVNLEQYEKRNDDIVLFTDFDGVVGDAESEKVFQSAQKDNQNGVHEFLRYEESLKGKPMELGPLGRTIQTLSRAVKYQKKMQLKSGARQEIEVKIVVVTARSGQAMNRFFKTLEHYDIEISQACMMQGRDKNTILSAMGEINKGKTLLFFDDSKTHITRSRELVNIASIWVPNDENTIRNEEKTVVLATPPRKEKIMENKQACNKNRQKKSNKKNCQSKPKSKDTSAPTKIRECPIYLEKQNKVV